MTKFFYGLFMFTLGAAFVMACVPLHQVTVTDITSTDAERTYCRYTDPVAYDACVQRLVDRRAVTSLLPSTPEGCDCPTFCFDEMFDAARPNPPIMILCDIVGDELSCNMYEMPPLTPPAPPTDVRVLE